MKKTALFTIFFVFISSVLICHELSIVSHKNTEVIAQNWLAVINKIPFKDRIIEYQLAFKEEIKSGDNLIAHVYHLAPGGHILVTPYRELNPIKSFSFMSNFDIESDRYEKAVIEELSAIVSFLSSYEKGSIEQIDDAIKSNKEEWKKSLALRLATASVQENEIEGIDGNQQILKYTLKDEIGNILQLTNAVPLLETKWAQSEPYWNLCPLLNGKRSLVGCVATAMAQIMRYYKWPKKGTGSYSYYWWDGGKTLTANFSDSYDWDHMPNLTSQYDSKLKQDAVSELCYEAGVSVEMEYSPESSGAFTYDVPRALSYYFRYQYYPKLIYRYNFYYSDWISKLKRQRDLMRPVLLAIRNYSNEGHAVVMDGYVGNMFHINMGWDGYKDAYYYVDNIDQFTNAYLTRALIDIIPDAAVIKLNKTSISISRLEGTSNPLPRYFKISNTGTLYPWKYRIFSQNSWLSYSVIDSASNVEVSVDISNLIEGKYVGKLRIESDDAINSPQYFTVDLTILPPPIYAPLNVSGTRTENWSLSYTEYIDVISWQPNPQNKNIEKYRLYKVDGNSQLILADVDASSNEYWYRDITPSSCTYMIKAINSSGRIGDPATCIIN